MRLNTNQASDKSQALVSKILNKIEGLSKPRKIFMESAIILFLSLRGRHTFKGMERYGDYCEKTYRLHFEKPFDFLNLNIALCESNLSANCILALDPSYLPKSGKKTYGKGKYWSGCLGKATQGIEITGIGVIDLDHHTAFSLESVQTPGPESLKSADKTLVDHYAQIVIDRKEELQKLSNYLVVDGYFSKLKFVDAICDNTSLELVGKLRQDANLKYLYKGPQRQGRGRPKKYAGKVNTKNIDKRRFKKVYQTEDEILYEAIVWSVSLKRKIKVVYVEFLKDGQSTKRYALYYSSDLTLEALKVYQYYKARFQIEFLFRDAKQYTGLTHCQARSENKIHFHTNLALTAIGFAKIAHYFGESEKQDTVYSIAEIKTLYFNELMLNLFLSNFQIDPNLEENKIAIEKTLKFGSMAA